jgi:GTPase SAR1 family protein
VLIGEAGVGKTAIVEGLAQKIASNDVPEILTGKRVVALRPGGYDCWLPLSAANSKNVSKQQLKKSSALKENHPLHR